MDSEPVKNHYIKHGLPCNKGDLNVFAYNIPNSVTIQKVRDYFSMFGSIKKIHLLPQYKTPTRQIAFIEFENGRCISKVLQTTHYFRSEKIHVKYFNDWNQLDDLKTEERTSEEGSETDIHASPILKLNFECLELIFSHLNTCDRISFARTCDKFYEAFSDYAKLKYKVVKSDDLWDLSLCDSRTLFEIAGSNIEEIYYPSENHFRLHFLKFVPNLKTLSLEEFDLRGRILSEFAAKLNLLSVVSLQRSKFDDGTVLELRKLPSLEKLYLSCSGDFGGENLHLLTNLKELDLRGCRKIQNHSFIDMWKYLKNLTLLDIRGCLKLRSNAFNEIGKQLTNLETLGISCRQTRCKSIANLPKLKNLMIDEDFSLCSDLFVALAEKRFNELEYLAIESENVTIDDANMIAQLKNLKVLHLPKLSYLNDDYLREFAQLKNLEVFNTQTSNITNTGLRHLVENCSKLKILIIDECEKITNDFVFDLIKIRQQSGGLLTLYADWSGIDGSILNDPEYVAASAVLKINLRNFGNFF